MEGPQPAGRLPLSASFCRVDAPNVVVLALKQAEDGRGIVLRLWEIAGLETTTRVEMPHLSPKHAFQTDLVEDDRRLLAYPGEGLAVTLKPFSVVTLRLIADDGRMGL